MSQDGITFPDSKSMWAEGLVSHHKELVSKWQHAHSLLSTKRTGVKTMEHVECVQKNKYTCTGYRTLLHVPLPAYCCESDITVIHTGPSLHCIRSLCMLMSRAHHQISSPTGFSKPTQLKQHLFFMMTASDCGIHCAICFFLSKHINHPTFMSPKNHVNQNLGTLTGFHYYLLIPSIVVHPLWRGASILEGRFQAHFASRKCEDHGPIVHCLSCLFMIPWL